MIILLHRDFKKTIKRFPKSIRLQFGEHVQLLHSDPAHPLLHIHELSGEYRGLWSMNVTGDIRAVYEIPEKEVIHFVDIGTHHQLFGT